MLIDAGDNSEGTAVQSYLDSQNVEKIDYAIGTHPDADHIGGLDVVVYKFDCKRSLCRMSPRIRRHMMMLCRH